MNLIFAVAENTFAKTENQPKTVYMKSKFRISLLLPAFASIILISCRNDGQDRHLPTELSIVPSITELYFEAAVPESYTFNVATDAESWDAVTDAGWINIEKTGDSFTVSCKMNFSFEDRESDTVTVVSGDAVPVKIVVSQKGLNVYMCGTENNVAAYWHNGEKTVIGTENWTTASSIYATGNGDIHIVGRNGIGSYYNSFYWSSTAGWSEVSGYLDANNPINLQDVTVDESTGDVYYSGEEGTSVYEDDGYYQVWVAEYFKNTTERVGLTQDGVSQGIEIIADDGDIYALVSDAYFVNGEKTSLESLGESVHPVDMYLHDGDIYVGGFYYNGMNVPCYWKNGKAFSVSADKSFQVYSSYVDNSGNIYLGGSEGYDGYNGYGTAGYWKNGEKVLLPGITSGSVRGIIADDGHLFMVGFDYDNEARKGVIKYWIDGEEIAVTDGSSDCNVFGVFFR